MFGPHCDEATNISDVSEKFQDISLAITQWLLLVAHEHPTLLENAQTIPSFPTSFFTRLKSADSPRSLL
jgi:hypothetical protein